MLGIPATSRSAIGRARTLSQSRDHAGAIAVLDAFITGQIDGGKAPAPTLFLKRAHLHNLLQNWRGGESDARSAIAALARNSDLTMAMACSELGQATWHLHGAAAALPWFRRTRRLLEQRGGPAWRLAMAYDNEALCLHALGRFEAAKRSQTQGLVVATKHGLHGRRRSLLRRMANVLQDQGHEDEAAELLQAAKPPARASVRERLGWCHSQALLAERRGRYAEADAYYDRATELFEANHDSVRDMVACLLNAALLKAQLQSTEQARRLLEVAERLAPPDPPSSYFVKRGVADAFTAAAEGRLSEASALLEEVRRRARHRNSGNRAYEAEIVAMHAGLLRGAGEVEAAEQLLGGVVSSDEGAVIPDGAELPALQLVELQIDRGADARSVVALLRQLFIGAMPLADHETRWRILSATAELAALMGRADAAVFFGKLAVVEAVNSAASLSPDAHQHQAILARRQAAFLAVFRRLVAMERLVEANRVDALRRQERARGLVMRRAPYGTETSGLIMTDAELGWREAVMSALGDARQASAAAANPLGTAQRRKVAGAGLVTASAALGGVFDDALDPRSASGGKGTDALRLTEDELPPAGSAILRYFIHDGRTMVQAASASGVSVRVLEVERSVLLPAIYEFVETLRCGGRPEPGASRLYEWLLAPLRAQLEGAALLEIIADGALAALPFGALRDENGYLVRRHAFAYRTGVALAARTTGPGTGKSRARLFGVSKALSGLPSLEYVPRELAGVARALPGARKSLNGRFTAAVLEQALAGGADIVHIASHHHLVPGSPTRSFLLLGDGKRLPIADLFSGSFTWGGVDLVFLSGCETAAGDTTLAGGDSIAAAFHEEGVSTVIATLWPTADASAALIAPRFYRELRTGAPAEAMRQAQCALLGGDEGAMAHPTHWAPFKLFVRGR